MLHPENIRIGMKIIATGVRDDEKPFAEMNYKAYMEMQLDVADFRRIAGVPLHVTAILFLFVIVRFQPLDSSAARYGPSLKIEERPLDMRRYIFDKAGRRYASRLPPITPEMDWQEANRVIDEMYRKAGKQRPG